MLARAERDDAAILGRTLGDGFKLEYLLDDDTRLYQRRAMTDADGNKTKAADRQRILTGHSVIEAAIAKEMEELEAML